MTMEAVDLNVPDLYDTSCKSIKQLCTQGSTWTYSMINDARTIISQMHYRGIVGSYFKFIGISGVQECIELLLFWIIFRQNKM